MLEGILKARERNPRFQYVLENVAAAAHNKTIVRALGEAMIIPGCVYGRKSGKKYAVWMSPEAEALYKKTIIAPADLLQTPSPGAPGANRTNSTSRRRARKRETPEAEGGRQGKQ